MATGIQTIATGIHGQHKWATWLRVYKHNTMIMVIYLTKRPRKPVCTPPPNNLSTPLRRKSHSLMVLLLRIMTHPHMVDIGNAAVDGGGDASSETYWLVWIAGSPIVGVWAGRRSPTYAEATMWRNMETDGAGGARILIIASASIDTCLVLQITRLPNGQGNVDRSRRPPAAESKEW